MCALGGKVPRENGRTNTRRRDQEEQNSNKVEGSGNVNQKLEVEGDSRGRKERREPVSLELPPGSTIETVIFVC